MDMRTCQRCGRLYDWRESSSPWLKMTVCGILCEYGLLGFTLEAFLAMERKPDPNDIDEHQRIVWERIKDQRWPEMVTT